MGLFHKTLLDARKKIEEENDVDGAVDILKKHTDRHCIIQSNSSIIRLKRYLERYTSTLINATSAHMGMSDEEYKGMILKSIDVCEDALKKIKRELNRLIKTERIKLE